MFCDTSDGIRKNVRCLSIIDDYISAHDVHVNHPIVFASAIERDTGMGCSWKLSKISRPLRRPLVFHWWMRRSGGWCTTLALDPTTVLWWVLPLLDISSLTSTFWLMVSHCRRRWSRPLMSHGNMSNLPVHRTSRRRWWSRPTCLQLLTRKLLLLFSYGSGCTTHAPYSNDRGHA